MPEESAAAAETTAATAAAKETAKAAAEERAVVEAAEEKAAVEQTSLEQKSVEKKSTATPAQRAFAVFLGFAVLLGIAVAAIGYTLARDLEIIAAVVKIPPLTSAQGAAPQEGSGLMVTGRVVQGALPQADVSIWCVGNDSNGNAYTPHALRTNADGEFKFEAIPEKLGDAVKEIRITANFAGWLRFFSSPTTTLLSVGSGGEAVKLSQLKASWWLLIPPICFILTIGFVASASMQGSGARWAYYVGLGLSLALAGSTVWFVADAINTFNTSVPRGQVRTLGFLTIFEGTYVENSGAEWLVSLTYPSGYLSLPAADRTSGTTATIVHGLGAPFWVIFLSVLGAGLLTLILVIQGISSPPDFASPNSNTYSDRMRAILEHQFFVLFAPLSGIFVFQLLVLAGAAKEPVTVATIILGAGATLNGLLSRAVKSAEQYVTGDTATRQKTASRVRAKARAPK